MCVCSEREKKIPFFYHAHFLSLRKKYCFLKIKKRRKENEISVFFLSGERMRQLRSIKKPTELVELTKDFIEGSAHRKLILRYSVGILKANW